MITRTVTYKGQDIKLTYCLKVLFLFEQIMEKMFSVKTVTDTYMFVLCCLIVADPDYMKGGYSKIIAAGEEDSTVFKISPAEAGLDKVRWSAEDLGVARVGAQDNDGNWKIS